MDPAQERNATITRLEEATARLISLPDNRLIPPDGISFGYAMRGARDTSGVAAVIGGIRSDAKAVSAGTCAFGTGEPVVRIILTAMKFDPDIRSAALMQYSGRALRVFEDDLFLECCSVDMVSKNPGIDTMDWRIASCCKDGVPDVIIRKGTGTADSRIILFGEGPAVVANNIIICSNRI
jgi:thiamine-phosphate diphosphorylase